MLAVAIIVGGCNRATVTEELRLDKSSSIVTLFLSSIDVSRTVAVHHERVLGDCLRRRGWEYVDKRPDELTSAPQIDNGLNAAEFAATYGFGIFWTPPLPDPLSSANAQFELGLSRTEAVAYMIVVQGSASRPSADDYARSCSAEADKSIAKYQAITLQLLDQYQKDVEARLVSSDIMSEARQKWTDCMRQRGIPGYNDRISMIQDLVAKKARVDEGGLPLENLPQFELQAAIADSECQVGFFASTEPERLRLEQSFIENNSEMLGEVQRQYQAMLEVGE